MAPSSEAQSPRLADVNEPYRSATSATALGTPLEPGERVIYVLKTNYRLKQIVTSLVGFLLLVGPLMMLLSADSIDRTVVVGTLPVVAISLGTFACAFFIRRLVPRGTFITDRRLVLVTRTGAARAIALADIGDVEAMRQVNSSRLPIIAIQMAQNHAAGTHPKADPSYWERTGFIHVVSMTSKLKIPVIPSEARRLGPFLVRCAFEPDFAKNAATVAVDP